MRRVFGVAAMAGIALTRSAVSGSDRRRRGARRAFAATPADVGTLGAGIMFVVTNDHWPCAGWQRVAYRDTSVPGLIVGLVGLVVAGLRAWKVPHGDRGGALPTLSVQYGKASMGLTTSF